MERVTYNGMMVENIKDALKMTKDMGKEYSNGEMVEYTEVNG